MMIIIILRIAMLKERPQRYLRQEKIYLRSLSRRARRFILPSLANESNQDDYSDKTCPLKN